jgi:hypothetical protein
MTAMDDQRFAGHSFTVKAGKQESAREAGYRQVYLPQVC